MAEDLGTWPPEQATVLVEVLQQSGITPQARRTRDGVEVTVEDGDSDQAHATLVANMDRIARAARPTPPQGGRRRPRATGAPAASPRSAPSEGDRPLASQRMSRLLRPGAILLAALLLVAIPIPLPLRLLVLAAAVLAIVWLLGRDDDGEDG